MKKLSILIALLVVAAFGFAQDVAFDGDATLTVGFDLDTNQFGFENAASASLSVTWTFDDATAGGTQAFITLSDMSFEAADDAVDIDDPSIEAGLIFAPLTITIYSEPDMSFGNADGFEFVPTATEQAGVDPALTAANTFQGFTVTADIDPLTVDIFVVSDGTWVENTDNAVAFGATVGASIDPLSVEAGVLYGPTSGAELGATVGVGGTFGPADLDIGFDFFESSYDASVDLGIDLGAATISSLTFITGFDGADLEMYEEVVVDVTAVEGLTFTNTTQLDPILAADALRWYNGTDLAYDLGGIKPFAMVELYDVAELDMDLEVGVELTGQIELTTFTLKWEADSLLVAESLGVVSFATKIEY